MKNNDNNLLNNIEESSYNDSKNKDSSMPDFVRDLSSNSINKPWYKKKASIIAMSSTLGAGILTTAIAVPLVLTSTQNTAELSKVITVYDLTNKTAKLVVEGKNLPNDKTLYSVFRETTTKALTEIKEVTLKFISTAEIILDFKDPSITTGTTKPMYQVKLNNGTSSGSTIVSKPEETLPQPTFRITTQPSNVTLYPSNTQNATFTVTPSTVTNEISGQNFSYQWKMSDIETTTDETKWTTIPNATNSSYTYDAKGLDIGTKKYFTCTVSYKYANSITTTPVSVVKVNEPSINISAQTQNVNLAYSSADSTTTLSVTAEIVNETPGNGLTYQWKMSETENGTFNNIDSATASTFNVTNITAGSKKYYKCTISYVGATSVDSTIIYVAKAVRPVVRITLNLPSTINLTHVETSTTLRIAAAITDPVDGETLNYQWQEATTNVDSSFTNISGAANAETYEVTNVAFGSTKYYRCKVSTTSAMPIISTIVTLTRVAQPTFIITTQPTAQTPLTSASTSFSLTVAATVTSGIANQVPTYQWKSSTSQSGTYENIVGATSATYTKQLDENKNSLRDTWYKCEVTYIGATTPTILSNAALVKMELTADEAKIELLKWLAIEDNAKFVLTAYFNEPIETSFKNKFYNSLHDHKFPEGNPNLEVHSIEPMLITANADYPTGYKSYKIKLKTTSTANITKKSTSGASTRTVYQAGMIIEFNTLFSFGGEKVEFHNTTSNSKNNMILQPTFTTYNNKPTTTLLWNTIEGGSTPTVDNPYKKGAYPVKFYENAAATTPIISDSVLMPAKMQNVYTSGTSSYLYTMIPTYHIKATN